MKRLEAQIWVVFYTLMAGIIAILEKDKGEINLISAVLLVFAAVWYVIYLFQVSEKPKP